MKIYEKRERHELITTDELDRLVNDADARLVLEAERIKLLNGKPMPLTDSASFYFI